ncbi:MAG: outer membrane beta-barrel protein [Bacteriovoracia bacterium]
MNFKILTLFIALFISTASWASFHSFGVFGGLNTSSPRISNEDVKPNNYGIFGLLLELSIKDNFYFKPEMQMRRKGNANWNVSAIEVPLLFKYLVDGLFFRPYLEAGPSPSYILAAENKTGRVKKQMRSFDFSADVGAGLEVSFLPETSIFTEFRYALGFVDLTKSAEIYKSQNFLFLFGVKSSL